MPPAPLEEPPVPGVEPAAVVLGVPVEPPNEEPPGPDIEPAPIPEPEDVPTPDPSEKPVLPVGEDVELEPLTVVVGCAETIPAAEPRPPVPPPPGRPANGWPKNPFT